MKEKHSHTDGFRLKRPTTVKSMVFGSVHEKKHSNSHDMARHGLVNNGSRNITSGKDYGSISRDDLRQSLDGLNDEENHLFKQLSKKEIKKLKKQKKHGHKTRSILKRLFGFVFFLFLVGGLSVAGYMGYKLANVSSSVIQGNIFDIFKTQELKEDVNGRSNFLILGTSEDDAGHAGGFLTDSMLIVSVDQDKKDVYMFSVPRDLYVKYGVACPAGYYGKINSYFICSNDGEAAEDEQDRLKKTQKLVGDIFGLDIQYGIHINHTVIKEVVDAIGGINVDIQGSNGAPGVLDRNFDWRCNFKCYLVKYDNGVHHLDGEHALFLSMARGDIAPTYGLSNSNFDREVNQQKIAVAVREKALSAGTLSNLNTITQLMDALGNNLRTNIQTGEIQTLVKLASSIDQKNINSISLVDEENSVMTTGMYGGASVVMPAAGIFEYSEIQDYISSKISSDPVLREKADITIMNGTGVNGYGTEMKGELLAKKYNIVGVETAPEGSYGKVEIYYSDDKFSGTVATLESMYSSTAKKGIIPVEADKDSDIVIIFGEVINS